MRRLPVNPLSVLTAGAAASLLTASAFAQDGEMRQLGAHVHGEARLSVAIDPESGLALAELSGAAWNFYGFEHAPRTEAERETIAAVRSSLAREGLIVWPDRAGCTLSEVALEAAMTGSGDESDHGDDDHDRGDHDHGDHDHGDHDHGHAHDDDHGSDHGHEHDPDHGAEAGHSDVTASWSYQCERIGAAGRFDAAGVFSALPRLERINAEAFDGSRAAVRTLTAQDAVITLD